MVEQGVDGVLAAVDEVDDARREAGLLDQLEDAALNDRVLLGGLEDEGVAAGDGVGQEPEGDHEREVEGGDRREDAERLVDDFLVDAPRGAILEAVAHHQGRDAAGGLDVVDAALDLAAGIVERLAHLGHDQPRQLLPVFDQQLAQREEIARPLLRRRRAPGREGRGGGPHGGVDVGRVAQRHARKDLIRRRVAHLLRLGRRRLDPIARRRSSSVSRPRFLPR